MSVGSNDLAGLSVTAGFDVTTLYNNGFLNISEAGGSFNQAVISAGSAIGSAAKTAGVEPVQNGIPLILAVAQDDGLAPTTVVQLLVAYAHAYTGTTVAQDVGTEIASLVQAGTLIAATAVSDTAIAALAIASNSSATTAIAMGQQLGATLAQLAGSLGSDPVVAAVQAINGATTSQSLGGGEFGLFIGLSAANAASVQTGLEGLLGSNAASLSPGDLSLSNPATAGVDIANAVYAAYGTAGAANFWQGVALIQVLAQRASVSPVTALVYYTNQLTSLSNSATIPNSLTSVGVELKAIIADGLVVNTSAASDVTSAVISIAASGSAANAVAIGSEFGSFLSPLVAGGGEGGGFNPFTASLAQINSAIPSTLSVDQGISLLAGASLTAGSRVTSTAVTELRSLVTSGTSANHVIALLALANAPSLAANFILSSGSTLAATIPQIDAAIQPSQLSATQAVSFIESLIVQLGLELTGRYECGHH